MTQNAFDVPLTALAAPAPVPQWNPMAPPAPLNYALPPGLVQPPGAPGPVPSAAPAARQRKDQRKDVATKVGRQVLSRVPAAAAVPPPPPNSTSDAVPVRPVPSAAVQDLGPRNPDGSPMAAPEERNVAFKPATYQPPKKGLEYLALGLGLLFPGAPIARAAASFAGGLQQGAQQKYQREETAAEQDYKAEQANAQNEFKNAVSKYGIASDEAKRAALNAAAKAGVDDKTALANYQTLVDKYNANQQLRARGLDPTTQKPFILPPALQRILPPGTNRPVTATDYASHENALAQFYTGVGATEIAAQHAAAAKEYNQRAIDDANNARALAVAMDRERHQDARTAAQIGAADYRAEIRENRADARALLADSRQQGVLRDEALRAGQEFYAAWDKALKPPSDVNGNPRVGADGNPLPAAVLGPRKDQLGKLFSTIDRDSAPGAAAQHFAETTTSPAEKELILARGRSADLARRAKGLPIIPHAFAPIDAPKKDDALPATRIVQGTTFYLHSDKKYYPTPEGQALPLNMDAAASGTP